MRKAIGLIMVFSLSTGLFAQSGEIYFNGNYINSSFNEFVAWVEESTGVKFYYADEWVETIKISAVGDSLNLQDVLRDNLAGTDLHFYISPSGNVFITKGQKLITKLPESSKKAVVSGLEEDKKGNGITDIEKMYLKGRDNGLIETRTLGERKAGFENKTVIISGKITDTETGEALIGATIYFKEIAKACVSDLNGHYSIAIKQGKYNASINCLGMKELKYILEVYSSADFDIEMEKTLIPINEVTIKAENYHIVKGMQMGFERISIKETKDIPLVLGEKDILKVAAMLPGVQNVGEGSAGLNVRGSAADQNMFYMNKVPVYNTAHLFGFFTSFSPDIIKDFSFYKSSLPAKYGGRLSSFFDITAKQGNKKNYTARGGISPITGHIAVEGPIIKEKSSFVLSARSTYSDWILGRLHNADLRNSHAQFYDLAAHITYEHNENNLFKVFAYNSHDRFSLAEKSHYEYSNLGLSLNWWHRYSNRHNSETAVVLSSYHNYNLDSVNSISAYQQKYILNHYEFRWDFSYLPFENHAVKYGLNLIYYNLDRGMIEPVGPESDRRPENLGVENGIEGAIYLSDEYRLSYWLTVYGGIRFSYFAYLGPKTVFEYESGSPKTEQYVVDTKEYTKGQLIKSYYQPEYRATANFRAGPNSSIKLSYNRTRQYLFMLSNTIAISPTDQWKLCDYNIVPPLNDQVSGGFYKTINNPAIDISAEVYFKKMKDIIQYKDGADLISSQNVERDVLPGSQEAYGVELLVKKNTGKLTGWLSYCYSRSIITVDGEYDWQLINNGISFPSNYDKPHAFNGILNYKVNRRLSFSMNVVYSTGRPITYPLAIFYVNGSEQAYYSDRNSYRIPDYFRLDFSINLEGNLVAKKLMHSFFMLNVYNLTGRENTYSVFFRTEDGKIQGYKMSVFAIPIITLSWNFKLGNYASD
jgi:hypothetical protein